MLTLHDTQSLLNLQGVIVKKVTLDNNFIIINIEMDKTAHICPNCGSSTSHIHDYRQQLIKDIPAFGSYVILSRKKAIRTPILKGEFQLLLC